MQLNELEMIALVAASTGLPFLKAAELVAKADHIEILLAPETKANGETTETTSFAA